MSYQKAALRLALAVSLFASASGVFAFGLGHLTYLPSSPNCSYKWCPSFPALSYASPEEGTKASPDSCAY